jgi:hypothetical protein
MLLWLILTAMTPLRADAAEITARRTGDILPEIAAALALESGGASRIELADPDAAFFDVEGASPVLTVVSFDRSNGRFTVNVSADGQTLPIDGVARADARPQLVRAAYQAPSAPLVKRGSAVTMTYEIAGLKVTNIGVAMQQGGEGDLIDVKNVKSERIIKAEILDQGLVAVLSPRNLAQAEPR